MPPRKKVEQEKETSGGETLQEAAKAIGSALGTIARKTGIGGAKAPPKASGKLVKKLKKRLPRKQKKEAKKLAAKT